MGLRSSERRRSLRDVAILGKFISVALALSDQETFVARVGGFICVRYQSGSVLYHSRLLAVANVC